MAFENLTHLQLTADTIIKPFKCKDSDLNGFLIEDAKNYLTSKMAVTYLFEDKEKNITVAYYSLLNDKITFDPEQRSFWNRLNRTIANEKRRKDYPAVKIGRLAVAECYTGTGIGTEIIRFIKYMFAFGNRTGCRFITVDAYAEATEFYLKCGFNFISEKDKGERTRSMYYDLINIVD